MTNVDMHGSWYALTCMNHIKNEALLFQLRHSKFETSLLPWYVEFENYWLCPPSIVAYDNRSSFMDYIRSSAFLFYLGSVLINCQHFLFHVDHVLINCIWCRSEIIWEFFKYSRRIYKKHKGCTNRHMSMIIVSISNSL